MRDFIIDLLGLNKVDLKKRCLFLVYQNQHDLTSKEKDTLYNYYQLQDKLDNDLSKFMSSKEALCK